MDKHLLFWIVVVTGAAIADEVTYDHRSLIVNGVRKVLFSGSIHYPRSTPQMWPSLIAQAKEGGIDVIDTYVFWNLHEQQEGIYDFSGRRDLVSFIKEINDQGLYACLRIGPFVEAEWNYGGFPFWLHDIPGIIFRTDNEPFKYYMKNFTTKIVNMMKAEKLYASQGGPIILSQIENEYGMIQEAFGQNGTAYVRWAAAMAVSLDTGVPWVMCKQNDAPDPVINTCNGLKCGETFPGPNSVNKPFIWTENWTTVFEVFGEEERHRSPEDIAFQVALFISKNGSLVNYYMYHGGTNFGRTASAYVTTSYYDAAPIDEYGLIREPVWSHLKELHAAIKLSLDPLLYGEGSTIFMGEMQHAYVFKQKDKCTAFLVNNDTVNDAKVLFQNSSYDLPRKSISILTDCRSVAFNTAKSTAQRSRRSIKPGPNMDASKQWQEYREVIPLFDDTSVRASILLEHMNTTKDISDYLWYTFRAYGVQPESQPVVLQVYSLGHVLHAFVNGELIASVHGSHKNSSFTLESQILLTNGVNNISLLSATVGLPDSGAYLERKAAGIRQVEIKKENGSLLLSPTEWGYQVGLSGERLRIYKENSSEMKWNKFENSSQPLTWYKTVFDAPQGTERLALNLGGMGKGEVWVNGESIGRYWVSFRNPKGVSQQWYHVPRSFLKPSGNVLVLLEEEGASPLRISLDVVSSTELHGPVSDCSISKEWYDIA